MQDYLTFGIISTSHLTRVFASPEFEITRSPVVRPRNQPSIEPASLGEVREMKGVEPGAVSRHHHGASPQSGDAIWVKAARGIPHGTIFEHDASIGCARLAQDQDGNPITKMLWSWMKLE